MYKILFFIALAINVQSAFLSCAQPQQNTIKNRPQDIDEWAQWRRHIFQCRDICTQKQLTEELWNYIAMFLLPRSFSAVTWRPLFTAPSGTTRNNFRYTTYSHPTSLLVAQTRENGIEVRDINENNTTLLYSIPIEGLKVINISFASGTSILVLGTHENIQLWELDSKNPSSYTLKNTIWLPQEERNYTPHGLPDAYKGEQLLMSSIIRSSELDQFLLRCIPIQNALVEDFPTNTEVTANSYNTYIITGNQAQVRQMFDQSYELEQVSHSWGKQQELVSLWELWNPTSSRYACAITFGSIQNIKSEQPRLSIDDIFKMKGCVTSYIPSPCGRYVMINMYRDSTVYTRKGVPLLSVTPTSTFCFSPDGACILLSKWLQRKKELPTQSILTYLKIKTEATISKKQHIHPRQTILSPVIGNTRDAGNARIAYTYWGGNGLLLSILANGRVGICSTAPKQQFCYKREWEFCYKWEFRCQNLLSHNSQGSLRKLVTFSTVGITGIITLMRILRSRK